MMTPRQIAELLDKVSESFGSPGTIVEAAALAGIKVDELYNFMCDANFQELMTDEPEFRDLMLAYTKTIFCIGALAERRRQ